MIAPETWALCVAVLTDAGYKEPSARTLIGRQLVDWDEITVVEAYQAAAGKADPKGYALAVLKGKPKKRPPENPQLRLVMESPPASKETAMATIKAARAILGRRSSGGMAGGA